MSDAAVDEVETEAGSKELLIATCECMQVPETATDDGQDNSLSILLGAWCLVLGAWCL